MRERRREGWRKDCDSVGIRRLWAVAVGGCSTVCVTVSSSNQHMLSGVWLLVLHSAARSLGVVVQCPPPTTRWVTCSTSEREREQRADRWAWFKARGSPFYVLLLGVGMFNWERQGDLLIFGTSTSQSLCAFFVCMCFDSVAVHFLKREKSWNAS